MRVRVVLAATAALLATAAPSLAASQAVERGIVQSIHATAIVLRALDGTEVTVPLGPDTRYRLNGRAATIDEIRPGFVAEAVTAGSGPAIIVRAFGRPERVVERGLLVRIVARRLVLRRGPGDTIRIAIDDRTAVWRGDRRVRPRALRPGMRLEVTVAANGSARVIVILRAPR